jgi:hypothetical protein
VARGAIGTCRAARRDQGLHAASATRALPRARLPVAVIDRYLDAVCGEAEARGYRFDRGKLGAIRPGLRLPASDGQLAYEWSHLLAKLQVRDPGRHAAWRNVHPPDPHPLFDLSPGPIASWERP